MKESVGTISDIAKKQSNSSAARLMDRVSGLDTDRRMNRVNNIGYRQCPSIVQRNGCKDQMTVK